MPWSFIRQIALEEKSLPRAEGPESIEYLPKYPELSAQVIFTTLANHQGFLRYFPDGEIQNQKVDRGYLFSVIRWYKPGCITLLLKAANRRKSPLHLQNEIQEGQLPQNEITRMISGQHSHHKVSKRAAFWMLSPTERTELHQAREENNQNAGANREHVARVIHACFNGTTFTYTASHTRQLQEANVRFEKNADGVVCRVRPDGILVPHPAFVYPDR